ncbi:hypothetical protein [Humibacter sp.]|uniref:hypothetical protein n=1 Tax=Humibacter sp. TaxID=1940291 RepID=UPI002B79866B|nr:hypothetical protein [Humibacter sp.]HVX07181.1 hypothetical protein [Humibacter sp.]
MKRIYRCERGSCVSRDGDRLDAYVSAVVVVERLARPDTRDLLTLPEDADAAAAARAKVDAICDKSVRLRARANG